MGARGIRFGTDGWRALIADEFTFDNVSLVGSAVLAYLAEQDRAADPLLIGYDNRFGAEHFAAHLANHLTACGARVIVVDGPCPTPVCAFGVQKLGCSGGIMLTASHNPWYYQGFKFIPWFAGPAMPDSTDRITELAAGLAAHFTAPRAAVEWQGEKADLREAYFAQLDTLVNCASICALSRPLLYSAMHGTGAGYLDGYLKLREVEVLSLDDSRDPMFGGRLPDPNPENLAGYAEQLKKSGAVLLAANDGDADRFGLLDPEGNYFSANELLPLLAEYLISYRRMHGRLVRTLCTSHLLDRVAVAHGCELVETAVGFKYVGDELRRGALIGGEESGGLSIAGHIPEKDGILAALLALELIGTSGESLSGLLRDLRKRAGDWRYRRMDLHLDAATRKKLLAQLGSHDGHTFAGREIEQIHRLDGTKFSFKDGSWLMLRASGTEDVVRIYGEAAGRQELASMMGNVKDYVQQVST